MGIIQPDKSIGRRPLIRIGMDNNFYETLPEGYIRRIIMISNVSDELLKILEACASVIGQCQ